MAYDGSVFQSKLWTPNDIKTQMESIFTRDYPLAWTSWTPTYGATGSMTYTSVTTISAAYIQIGKLVLFKLICSGTTGGTASYAITFTVPVTRSTADYAALAGGWGYDSATCGVCIDGGNSTTVARVLRYNFANWGLGASRQIGCMGIYEAA